MNSASVIKHPLALTMGEPAGIGAEITLKAWVARDRATPVFFAIDDAARLENVAKRFGIACPIARIEDPAAAAAIFPRALPVLALPRALGKPDTLGHPDRANASAVIGAIEAAAKLAMSGAVAGIVTNPIQKATLQEAGFGFPGHTEFLGHLAGDRRAVMMLAISDLRVVPITVHMALKDVASSLKADDIVACGRIAAEALRKDFGIAKPRLAVAALNPHAGEHEVMGDEETRIIAPAIVRLLAEGIDARGPAPADTLFHPAARRTFDAALCMYHDQALIPLKTLDFAGGVNVTLGLPFVRTSPDHGTALDIAERGGADASSLRAALALAGSIAAHRAASG